MFRNCSKLTAKNQLFQTPFYSFTVRVRYAPSPTGFMHIGGLRTALFNYLYAKKHAGGFIVRIEDTDKQREVQGSIQNIFQTLAWIGITPDESLKHPGQYGPYIQSERLPIYKNFQKLLLKNGMAFPCFCQDHKTVNDKQAHPYDGACRKLSFEQVKTRIRNKEEYAVRIKSDFIPLPATFRDEVFGELEFKALDDFVIVRKNGWPTFHFANVIDDWQMKITHVMRGEEWLTNTNKHIYLYKLLGAPVPKFVHLPLIKAMNGKKLAKRDPMSSIKHLQDDDYEVEAVKSMLATLGLDHKEESEAKAQNAKTQNESAGNPSKQKIQSKSQVHRLLTDGEMIEEFDISKVSRVPVKFDKKQLDHLNRLAIKRKWSLAQTNRQQMLYFINRLHQKLPISRNYPQECNLRMLGCVADRLHSLSELGQFNYYFESPNYTDQKSQLDFQKLYGANARLFSVSQDGSTTLLSEGCDPQLLNKNRKIVHNLRMIVEHVIEPSAYSEGELAKRISQFLVQSPTLKNEDVFHLLRFMVTGRKNGPNITQACAIIGQQHIIQRMALFSLV